MNTYLPSVPARILEIGSLNVNGSLRDHSPRNAEYVGLDFEAGESVDIVITGTGDWNVPDAHFDLVMASSVFEHDGAFWRTFLEMCRKTKPGGHIYVSAPSNGTIHRYPRDCWRFYPDAGLALEDWARGEGFDLTLIESFVAEREADGWNDFCAVFRLNPSDAELNRDFVHAKVPSTNALNWRSSLTMNGSGDTQDMRLLRAARDEANGLREATQTARQEADALRIEAETLRAEGKALRVSVRKAGEDIGALRIDMQALRDSLETARKDAERQDALHALEISQLTDQAETLSKEVERLQAEVRAQAQTHAQLAEQKATSEQRLQERFREIAGLTRLIQERDQALSVEQTRAEWLRQVISVLTKGYSRAPRARLATLMPAYFSYKRQEARLRQEGLFDSKEYVAVYPDVSRSNIHPFRHYITHGMLEGRVTRQGA